MGVLGSGHRQASIGLWPRSHFLVTRHGPHSRGQALGCNDPATNQVSSSWTSPLLWVFICHMGIKTLKHEFIGDRALVSNSVPLCL